MNRDELDRYLFAKPGTEKDFKEEWGWDCYMINGKMFAALVRDTNPPLLTLKLEPIEGEFYRKQYPAIIPGYYMNKLHWNSIRLDDTVPENLLREMMDKSYRLIFDALPKKAQTVILSVEKSDE